MKRDQTNRTPQQLTPKVVKTSSDAAEKKIETHKGVFSTNNLLNKQPGFEESRWRAKLVAMSQQHDIAKMKFENFKKKVADLIMSAHPGENLDIRNGSKLFKVLRGDLLAKEEATTKLAEAQLEISKLREAQGILLSARHKPSLQTTQKFASPVQDYLSFREHKDEIVSEQYALDLENQSLRDQFKESKQQVEKLKVKEAMLKKLTDNQMNLLYDFEKELKNKEELIKQKQEEINQQRKKMSDMSRHHQKMLQNVKY